MSKEIVIIHLLFSITNCAPNFILNSAFNLVKNVTPSIEFKINLDPLSILKINNTLNCFGIPITTIASSIEFIIAHQTKAEDVRFYFYSRNQVENVTIHAVDEFNLTDINFQINRQTVFIIHGFLSSGQEKWIKEMKNALLEFNDLNIVVVDWQKGANTWNYYSAAISTKIVGFQIAKIVDKIKQQVLNMSSEYKDFGSLHLVGHSLGAHISAHAAYLIKEFAKKENNSWIVQRITGLDPAQPCFKAADLKLKLSDDDAPFVDVIHTNARNILLLGLGLPDQLGKIDFYPNGGQMQLGCTNINTSFWNFLLLPANIIKEAICSHGRSYELFTDSIIVAISKNCTYIGHSWNKKYDNITEFLKTNCNEVVCPEMGINSKTYYPNKNGTYFVPTSNTSHYCAVTENDKIAIEKQLKSEKLFSNNINKILG